MRLGIICLCLMIPNLALAAGITAANFIDPTSRYDHGILGDDIEWGGLQIDLTDGRRITFTLPQSRVFEDLAPRLADIDGDGMAEVVVVETDISKGVRLSVYSQDGVVATTPYIGQTHRWLAPIGFADFDGDGRIEIAYIDRPHLAKILRLWRWDGSPHLSHVADLSGVTNHKIGWDFIAGGVRDCGVGPEMIVSSADWSRTVSVTYDGDFHVTDLAITPTPKSLAKAVICQK